MDLGLKRPAGKRPRPGSTAEPTATDAERGTTGYRFTSQPVPRGTMIGHFMVIDQLGSGACGLVVSAYDPDLDRKVALKVLRPDVLGAEDAGRARDRLMREAKALARIIHPNVITVHEVGAVGDQIYVAMEFVDGGTLRDTLSLRRRSWRQVLGLFLQAGRGLAAAHRAELVHRDFKPANVLVSRENRVVVTDFGLVSTSGDLAPGAELGGESAFESVLTETGTALGTPAYMAPEQHGSGAVDARSDQFAFCVALYEALYAVRPFSGSSLAELRDSKRRGAIARPPANAEVPAWLRATVLRGLSAEPEARFASMDDLLGAIEDGARPRSWSWVAFAAAALVVPLLVVGYQQLTASPDKQADSQAQVAALEDKLNELEHELVRTREQSATTAGPRDLEKLRKVERELARVQAELDAALETTRATKTNRRQSVRASRASSKAAGCHPLDPYCDDDPLAPRAVAAPDLDDRPDPVRVQSALAARSTAVRSCVPMPDLDEARDYESWVEVMDQPLRHDVGVTVDIGPDGTPVRIAVSGAAGRDLACIRAAIRIADFPRSREGGTATRRFRLTRE